MSSKEAGCETCHALRRFSGSTRTPKRRSTAFLADRARPPARPHQAPEGDAGHAAHEEARHRGTGTRCASVTGGPHRPRIRSRLPSSPRPFGLQNRRYPASPAISEGRAETSRRGWRSMWARHTQRNRYPLSRLDSRLPVRRPESASLPDPAGPAVDELLLRTRRKPLVSSVTPRIAAALDDQRRHVFFGFRIRCLGNEE